MERQSMRIKLKKSGHKTPQRRLRELIQRQRIERLRKAILDSPYSID